MSIEYNLEYINGVDMKPLYNNHLSEDETLVNYLNSLKLKEKLWNYNDDIYKIIQYDKNYLTNDIVNTIGLFRSVIVDKNNKIISFSPPKSLDYDMFKSQNEDESCINVEDYVEGTMINLFWNNIDNEWEISTKGTIGGKIIFFKTEDKLVTFRNLFLEVCNHINLDFNHLNKDYFYSFVMQHPKNRIVIPLYEKKLYLVKVYRIDNDTFKVYDLNKEMVYDEIFKDKNIKVELPKKHTFSGYKELEENGMNMNNPYDMVGFMIHSNNGTRTKIRNPTYEYVRKLRGNQPKLQYEYLSLRKSGKLKEFLKYYPEYKKQFYDYRKQLHDYTLALYTNYVNCYIKKEAPLNQFPYEFRSNMFKLHEHYINYLRSEKKHIHFKFVCEYINQLHPSQQMFYLNYNLKKQYLDSLKIDDALKLED